MVLHSQARVVRGESAVLAAKENIKTVLMEQTSVRKLTCTKKFVVGVLKIHSLDFNSMGGTDGRMHFT